jgi:hypothetical protein
MALMKRPPPANPNDPDIFAMAAPARVCSLV